jgi:hypothetical protein
MKTCEKRQATRENLPVMDTEGSSATRGTDETFHVFGATSVYTCLQRRTSFVSLVGFGFIYV